MCFGLFRAANNCLRALCGLLFCLICGGPICFIIGLVLLLSDNNREDRVKEYNNAVNAYSPQAVNNWVPATINGVSPSVVTQSVQVFGNLRDVLPATSTMLSATMPWSSTATYSLRATPAFTRTNVPQSATFTATAFCDNSWGCSNSQMNNYCVAQFGSTAFFTSSGSCSGRGNCGRCRFTNFLTEYCIVLNSGADAPYTESAQFRSCFFPFSANSQRFESRAASSNVWFTVRKADDPFIALQRLTEGDMDFGALREDERNAGIALLIIGIVMIVCMIIVAIMVCRFATKEKKPQQQQQQAGGGVTVVEMGAVGGGAARPPAHHHHHQPATGIVVDTAPYYPGNNNNGGGGGNAYGYSNSNMAPQQQQQSAYSPSNAYGYGNSNNNNVPPQQQQNNGAAYGYGNGNSNQQQQPTYGY